MSVNSPVSGHQKDYSTGSDSLDVNLFALFGAIGFVLLFFLCARFVCCRSAFEENMHRIYYRGRLRGAGGARFPAHVAPDVESDRLGDPLLRNLPRPRAATLPPSAEPAQDGSVIEIGHSTM